MAKRYQRGNQNPYIEQTTQWPKDTKGVIVLSVRYTDSDYPFGIFKLFLLVRKPECRIIPLTCRYSLTLYHMILYRVHLAWAGFELTTLVAIGTDCICCYTSNYQTMTTKTGWCYMVVYRDKVSVNSDR
jgi:hypothetical protein